MCAYCISMQRKYKQLCSSSHLLHAEWTRLCLVYWTFRKFWFENQNPKQKTRLPFDWFLNRECVLFFAAHFFHLNLFIPFQLLKRCGVFVVPATFWWWCCVFIPSCSSFFILIRFSSSALYYCCLYIDADIVVVAVVDAADTGCCSWTQRYILRIYF